MAISESDKIFFNTLKQADSIEVSYVERNNNLTNPSAAFFNYLNKTEFNLESIEIHQKPLKNRNPERFLKPTEIMVISPIKKRYKYNLYN